MKVGDLIRGKYSHDNKVAIILEIHKIGHSPYATVQFTHYSKPSRIFLSNFEVVNESR